jgi:hypothetical protein
MRNILLLGPGQESQEAIDILLSEGIEFDPLLVKKGDVWVEINWPLPTLFWQGKHAVKGLEKIQEMVSRSRHSDGTT